MKEQQMRLIPQDFCDTDLYKFTMGQVVWRQFPHAVARYRYTNRAEDKSIPEHLIPALREQIDGMGELHLTSDMYNFFKQRCPWLKETYLQWLRQYRFDPDQVSIRQTENGLDLKIEGPWFETIYWEVPLLYIITHLSKSDLRGNLPPMKSGWESVIINKGNALDDAGVNWIDFGTRRRACFEVQNSVCCFMKDHYPAYPKYGGFRGTSNPYLAMLHGMKAHGTNAHELTMAMQARYAMSMCNRMAMEHWVEEFRGSLGIALTDTVTTPVFLRDFDMYYAKLFDGVRQDSGDPFEIGELYIKHYEKLGIDPSSKVIVFSDSLNVEKAIQLHRHFKDRIKTTMGIGTNLTNDVGWQPSNHVIKLTEIDFGHGFQQLIKLSDSKGKHLGSKQMIEDAHRALLIS